VRAEIRNRGAILQFGTSANAVGQDGFQQLEIAPAQTELLVDNNSGEMLADALTHDAGLAVIDSEAFFQRDSGRMRRESYRSALECFSAGECQIVGVTRVRYARGFSQAE
jgi:hypothetical protein